MDISNIIFDKVLRLLAERLTAYNIQDYSDKWDALKAQIAETLENLNNLGTDYVEVNMTALGCWFKEILKIVDVIELRRSASRHIEAPMVPLVDDLSDFKSLPPFSGLSFLKPKDLFVRRELYESPTLEVLKEELTTHRLKQEALEAKMEDIVVTQAEMKSRITKVREKQESMEAKQAEMSLDIKTILQLNTKKP